MVYKVGDKITVDGEECEVANVYGEGTGYLVVTPSGPTKRVFAEQVSEVEAEGEKKEGEEGEEEGEEEVEEEEEEEEIEEEEEEAEEEIEEAEKKDEGRGNDEVAEES